MEERHRKFAHRFVDRLAVAQHSMIRFPYCSIATIDLKDRHRMIEITFDGTKMED